MSPTAVKSEDDYRAENDADTLQRAQEIEADPKRYKAAMKCLKEKHTHIKSAMGRKKLLGQIKSKLHSDDEEQEE